MKKILLFLCAICCICGLCGCSNNATECAVDFNTLGGSEIETQYIEFGNRITKPLDPIKDGYIFDGWYVNTDYSDENKWSFIGYTVSKDITLYAKWNAITDICISFDLNGGYGFTENKNVTYDNTYGALPQDILHTGYKFVGWFTSLEDDSVEIANNSLVKTANNHVLYAKWIKLFEGNGTIISPYQIDTTEQFNDFALQIIKGEKYQDLYFNLNLDINLNGKEWHPIGFGDYGFCGYFNGNGHIVQNFKITQADTSYFGLFGKVSNGKISHLGVENFDININSSNLILYAGGLVGESSSIITNCYAVGSITVNAHECTVGGLVGISNTSINNCFTDVNIIAISQGKAADCYAGGIAGINSAEINNCFTLGNVSSQVSATASTYYAYARAGGLVAIGNSSVSNCYRYLEQEVYEKIYGKETKPKENDTGEMCDLIRFNSADFYKSTLGWDEAFWNYSNVDLRNSQYPTFLKR